MAGEEAGQYNTGKDFIYRDDFRMSARAYPEASGQLDPEGNRLVPNPVELIKTLLRTVTKDDDIVLDFFSGSATTAQAVMELNAEDGHRRRYILVQLPEPTGEDSEACRAGFRTIAEIGKERIRRAAGRIRENTRAGIDDGFRVFRIDSSNMKDVYYAPRKIAQTERRGLISNIEEDRTGEDLLVQVMLEPGLDLSLPMAARRIEGKTVHSVAGNELIACFDDDVPESVIREIARERPRRAVIRDGSFADDAARINVDELFRLLSPGTDIRVL